MPQAKPPYKGQFEMIDFPEYKYQPYPCVMNKYDDKGKIVDSIEVDDADSEARAVADGYKPPAKRGPPKILSESEFTELEVKHANLEARNRELLAKLALLEAGKVPSTQPPAASAPPAPGNSKSS